ncbi:hypothetical protein GKZ68_13390 [Hymenobacter sp. BRD128]|uniref:hypothetical protein n=1 Tax=Hymenobacter sp. BRD128 TaxID=2675878 RepID=UPI001565F1E3|nr:hypothetical protein [Hymenobacter sp. BRD128]QKG57526.1 hypothetical protein GKZ68_13390 [Hymenobacter sp. BRD128]
MNQFFHWRWLLAGLLWLSLGPAAQASHIRGGDIAYNSIASTTPNVPRYRVTLRLFRDITGVEQPTVTLYGTIGDCHSVDPRNFRVDNILKAHTSRLDQVACVGSNSGFTSSFNTDVFLYNVDVDLPRGQWTLSFTGENRNAALPAIHNFYVAAFLDNRLITQDTSPTFLSTLLPSLQGNLAQRYSFSTYDADRDSVAYSLVASQEALDVQVPCGTAIAGAVSPHFQLNPATGAVTIPTGGVQQGYYLTAVRVDEYRQIAGTWQRIGSVTRDISYLAQNLANQPPSFTSLAVGASPAQSPDQTINIRAGQTVDLTLTAADPDAGQHLRFSSEATGIVPGLSLAALTATQARLTWRVPASLPPGFYTVTIAVFDDGCPNSTVEQTLYLRVTNQTLATRPATDAAAVAFPMPFRDQVQFQAITGGQLVFIVDELGRTVAQLRAGADGRVLWQPAASLPAGLYLARGADGRPLARLLHAAN